MKDRSDWHRRLPAVLHLAQVVRHAHDMGAYEPQSVPATQVMRLAGRIARYGGGGAKPVPVRAPAGRLNKGYDSAKHPREHDGKFARKTGEIAGGTLGAAGGATAGFFAGRHYGPSIGERLGEKISLLVTKNPITAINTGMFARGLGRAHGAAAGAVLGGAALGLAGMAGGRAVDRMGRNRRADREYQARVKDGLMTPEEAKEASALYRRSKGRGIARQKMIEAKKAKVAKGVSIHDFLVEGEEPLEKWLGAAANIGTAVLGAMGSTETGRRMIGSATRSVMGAGRWLGRKLGPASGTGSGFRAGGTTFRMRSPQTGVVGTGYFGVQKLRRNPARAAVGLSGHIYNNRGSYALGTGTAIGAYEASKG